MVLSDEIYNSLTYGPDRHVCFAEIDGMKERTIVVDGFSKSYAMTGWRLGWAMGPKELMRHICKIHQFGIMSAPTTAQFAGIEAIRTGDDDIARMRDQYDLRRRYLLGELRSMGLECFEPAGRVLYLPLHRVHRPVLRGVLRAPAARAGGRGHPRQRLRRERRGPHPHFLFLFDESSARGLLPHEDLPRKPETGTKITKRDPIQ